MIKRILLLVVLSVSIFSCKTKKTVRSVSADKKATIIEKTNPQPFKDDNDLYRMPIDEGKFIKFHISDIASYIEYFSKIAQYEMEAYGIPASITLAQGLLESGIGQGELAKKTNNHFGIKCHTGWEGDFDYYDDDEIGECFRKYNHPMYSYRDHSLFLTTRSRYASLFDLRQNDYKSWARGLKKAGYATDSRYPEKLISLIETHKLQRFDAAVLDNQVNFPRRTNDQLVKETTTEGIYKANKVNSSDKQEVYTVKKGDTLWSIAKKYSVALDDLKRWNYLYKDSLSIGQKLTVQLENFN